MSRITNDIQTVRFCIVNTLQVVFREPFLIIGYLVAMIAISWELTLFAIIYLPLVALVIGTIVKKLRYPALKAQEHFGEQRTRRVALRCKGHQGLHRRGFLPP